MSAKQHVTQKLLLPLLAAGTSVAASYVAKRGPAFVEDTVLPRLRDAAEELPEKARTAVGSGGELAEQLTGKARDAVGGDSGTGSADSASGRRLSRDELSRRSDERAKHRAQRRRKARR